MWTAHLRDGPLDGEAAELGDPPEPTRVVYAYPCDPDCGCQLLARIPAGQRARVAALLDCAEADGSHWFFTPVAGGELVYLYAGRRGGGHEYQYVAGVDGARMQRALDDEMRKLTGGRSPVVRGRP